MKILIPNHNKMKITVKIPILSMMMNDSIPIFYWI